MDGTTYLYFQNYFKIETYALQVLQFQFQDPEIMLGFFQILVISLTGPK